MAKEPISYFIFQQKTAFIPLRYIYGECWVLIEDHPKMFPLRCMNEDGCPANANCGEKISKRVHYLFEEVLPGDVEMIIGYFKYRDTHSLRAAIFERDMSEPRVSVINPYAFRKFMKEGTAYRWFPTLEYMVIGGKTHLPVIL